MNQRLLKKYAYYLASNGATGDQPDIRDIAQDDGLMMTEDEIRVIANYISDICHTLRGKSEGWQELKKQDTKAILKAGYQK